MIAGHFGFAAVVKSRETRVPLWALMLATVWLDILFVPLLVMKLESIDPVPGTAGGYGEHIIHADYTHSLLGALVISAVYGLFFAPSWGRRCAVVLGLVSFSHWVLDLLVHRGDMPLLPRNSGNLPRIGFGLWQFKAVSVATELVLVLAGAWCYWRAADAVTRERQKGRGRGLAAAVLIVVCGLLVLALDVTGVAG